MEEFYEELAEFNDEDISKQVILVLGNLTKFVDEMSGMLKCILCHLVTHAFCFLCALAKFFCKSATSRLRVIMRVSEFVCLFGSFDLGASGVRVAKFNSYIVCILCHFTVTCRRLNLSL